jgi:ribose 5-phosphate isomerase A
VVDERKLVSHLGAHDPVPVEVVPFGWQATARQLLLLGAKPLLRRTPDSEPFISDGGHYILDCKFDSITSATSLASEFDHVVGLVEHGLFIGLTSEVRIAGSAGVRVLKRRPPS